MNSSCAYMIGKISLPFGDGCHSLISLKTTLRDQSGLGWSRDQHQCRRIGLAVSSARNLPKQAVREAATICPAPCKLTFDLLTLKVVSESRVTWATSVPILVFLGFSVLDLGPMYATDRHARQTSDRRQTRIIA